MTVTRPGLSRRLLQASIQSMREDAVAWGVPGRLAAALFVAPLAGAIGVAASFADRPLFRFLTREDSLLEWSQFAAYAAAAALAIMCWRALTRAGNHRGALAYLLFALGCLFVAGEEISWGQRIFGWGTPAALEHVNNQRETTVHNMGRLGDIFNVILLCAGLYGVATAWLAARRARRWRDLPWLAVPPLFLTGALFVVLAYKAARFAIFVEPRYGVVKFGEWPELCFASALAVFSFLVWRRLLASARGGRRRSRSITKSRRRDRMLTVRAFLAREQDPT